MPKINIEVNILRFNRGGWTKTFEAMFEREFRKALKAFLEAAEPRVPVDTGMARGSLKILADWAGYNLDLSEAKPKKNRSPEAGEAKALLDISDFAFPKYGFTFNTKVYHYILHEHLNRIFNKMADHEVVGEAWKSFEYGHKAFKKYMEEHLKAKIPKISDFIERDRQARLVRGPSRASERF